MVTSKTMVLCPSWWCPLVEKTWQFYLCKISHDMVSSDLTCRRWCPPSLGCSAPCWTPGRPSPTRTWTWTSPPACDKSSPVWRCQPGGKRQQIQHIRIATHWTHASITKVLRGQKVGPNNLKYLNWYPLHVLDNFIRVLFINDLPIFNQLKSPSDPTQWYAGVSPDLKFMVNAK